MLVIRNGAVETVTKGRLEHGTVLIEQGKIAAIGEDLPYPEASEVIDAAGLVVLPGLVDAHTHLGVGEAIVGWAGNDYNEATAVTAAVRAIDGYNPEDAALRDAREAGITTVVATPGSANPIGGTSFAVKTAPDLPVDSLVVKNPVGLKAAFGENPKSVYGDHRKMPSTRMGTAAVIRQALLDAREYLHQLALDANTPRDLGKEAIGRVLLGELPLRIHAHRADDILTALRIVDEFGLKATIEHATEGWKIADEIRRAGVAVLCGPTVHGRSKVELKDMSLALPAVMAAAGIKFCIMTDHPFALTPYLTFYAATAIREGLAPDEALKAITIYPAEITGISDRVGSIEVGKDADLVLMDGDPFDFRTRVAGTLIAGKRVFWRAPREEAVR
jgi:imidazolonepropionase-like amidohydrolase